jgi:C-8 sterol isomerase
MPGECWALEYAHGNIVTMMPFGLIEVFTSTLDFESMFDTIVESGSQMLGNLRQGKV